MAILEIATPNQQIHHDQVHAASRTAFAERADSMQLIHNQVVEIDSKRPVYSAEAIGLVSGSNGAEHVVVAELASSVSDTEWGKHVAVIKSSDKNGNSTYYLYGLSVDKVTGEANAIDLPPVKLPDDGSTLWIGRDKSAVPADTLWGPGSVYSIQASRRQTSFTINNGELSIGDSSSNGTKLLGAFTELGGIENQKTVAIQLPARDPYAAEHTGFADIEALRKGFMTPEGKFAGRYRITRDTEIGGGSPHTIDIRSWQAGAEATVVDANSKEIEHWYRHYLDGALHSIREEEKRTGIKATEDTVLQAILNTVKQNMAYDLDFVDNVSKEMVDDNDEIRKVNLSYYMAAGKGVCRHMALACAWLGGELKQQGYLKGKTTAEVNQHADNGAHEWARYKAEDGTITILDVAGDHKGGSLTRKWDYRRKEEKQVIVPAPERIRTVETKAKSRFRQFFGRLFIEVIEESNNSR